MQRMAVPEREEGPGVDRLDIIELGHEGDDSAGSGGSPRLNIQSALILSKGRRGRLNLLRYR